ncbi:MAG: DoxX family protein [Ferruginibacter sp.]|nr:DoxX family protein [Cytophagales bacterium]
MKLLVNAYPLRDAGLLLLRIGLGLMFMVHGGPKLAGGPAYWQKIGESLAAFGITFLPQFWGFMAGFAEFGGGLLLLLGLFFRPSCLLLLITMVVATNSHLSRGDDLNGASHAIEAGVTFLGLLFIGPGRFSLDEKLFKSSRGQRRGKVRVK